MLGIDDFAGLKEAIETRKVVLFYNPRDARKATERFFGQSLCGIDSIVYNGFTYWIAVKWYLTFIQVGCVVEGRNVHLEFEMKGVNQ